MLRHPWASGVIESRTTPTPIVLEYMDSVIAMFRAGGFSIDLTHHVMHALGSRIFGSLRLIITLVSYCALLERSHQPCFAFALDLVYVLCGSARR
jgi:hypothetical protein